MIKNLEELEPYIEEHEYEELKRMESIKLIPYNKTHYNIQDSADKFLNHNVAFRWFSEGKTHIKWEDVWRRLYAEKI